MLEATRGLWVARLSEAVSVAMMMEKSMDPGRRPPSLQDCELGIGIFLTGFSTPSWDLHLAAYVMVR
jgi:hypothetical protein